MMLFEYPYKFLRGLITIFSGEEKAQEDKKEMCDCKNEALTEEEKLKSIRETQTRELFAYVDACDLSGIKKALEGGADWYDESVPLMCEVIKGTCGNQEKKDTLDYLMNQGAEMYSLWDGDMYFTPLLCAIMANNSELAQFLIDRGIDNPEKEDASLIQSLENGNCILSLSLLKAGVIMSEDYIRKEILSNTYMSTPDRDLFINFVNLHYTQKFNNYLIRQSERKGSLETTSFIREAGYKYLKNILQATGKCMDYEDDL